MISDRQRGLRTLFLFWQVVLLSTAFWGWLVIVHLALGPAEMLAHLGHTDSWDPNLLPHQMDDAAVGLHGMVRLQWGTYLLYNVLLGLGVALGFTTEHRSQRGFNAGFRSATSNALWQWLFSAGCLFVYLVGTQDKTISRAFLFSFLSIEYVLLTLTQRYLPEMLLQRSARGPYQERVALIGCPTQIVRFADWLRPKRAMGFVPAGIICDDAHAELPSNLVRLGAPGELERLIEEHEITRLLCAGLPADNVALQQWVEVCERQGVRFVLGCDFEERFGQPVTFFEDGGMRFVGLRQEPLEDPFRQLLKRALDVAVSVPVVVLVLPWTTLLVWLLQRWQSPGPLFFRQFRSGLMNRRFQMIKYRTMVVENSDETAQVRKDDPRVFAAGRWLRRLSIDELPQFLNVLRGDMSVVGPRPHMPQHDELFAHVVGNYRVRSVVKPGITGLAQVRGFRGGTFSEQDVRDRVRSDLEYLESWSLELDVSVIVRTIWQMLFPPRTAY